jgi:hypothetical protein
MSYIEQWILKALMPLVLLSQRLLHKCSCPFPFSENKCSKYQQQRWAEQGDQKIARKNSKNTGLSSGVEIFQVRE